MCKMRFFTPWPFIFVLLITVTTLSACSGDDAKQEVQRSTKPFSLRIIQGNLQGGLVGEDVEEELRVRAIYADGSPAVGHPLRFTKLSGPDEGKAEAVLDPVETLTDSNGFASCSAKAASTPGILRVRVESPEGLARPVTFHISIYPQATEIRKPVCFLSVNDFHTHIEPWGPAHDPQGGIARLAWAFQKIRENNSRVGVPTVILDGGDDFELTAYHDVPGLLAWMISAWDRMGMDVWQVGNHDCNFGLPFLTERLQAARQEFTKGAKGHPMHITWGNVDPSTLREDLTQYTSLFETDFDDTAAQKLYQQTTIVENGGVRIGVIGVHTHQATQTPLIGDPEFLRIIGGRNPYSEGMTFFNPVPGQSDYIARAIDSLVMEGAHVIVVLSHAGLGFGDRSNLPPGFDDKIAMLGVGAVTGRTIDLVVSAHSHVQLNHPIFVENPAGGTTPIVQARKGGLFIARVDAVADLSRGGLEILDSRLLQVNSDLEEDAQIAGEVAGWQEAVSRQFDGHDLTLVDNDHFLSHRAQTISGLGNLINDSFLRAMTRAGKPADISMVIPSLYRRDLWPGPVTGGIAHNVLPAHWLDETGFNAETLVVMTFRPGRLDASTLLLPGTWKKNTTSFEYLLEFVHTLNQIAEVIPQLGNELKVDILQVRGVSYEVDLTAPLYSHIVPGSVRIGGEPVDPDRTYRLVTLGNFASIMAPAINTLLVGFHPCEGLVKLLLEDPETGLPYTNTGILTRQAFKDYLEAIPGGEIAADDVTVKGEIILTEQPDLVINTTEMSVSGARRGEAATVSIRVRNNGKHGVKKARVRLLVDVTPWDLTDHDDGRGVLEGLGEDYLGSLLEIGSREIALGRHPASVDLDFSWTVPSDLPAGVYTLHTRVDGVIGETVDPNTGAPYTDGLPDNDSGEQVMTYFDIR